jgi:hypothetical protein
MVNEGLLLVRVRRQWQRRRRRGRGLPGQAMRERRMLLRLLVAEREELVGGVAEAGRHDDHGSGSNELSGDRATDDLARAAGEVDREAGGGRRRRGGQEGAAEREDLVAIGEVEDGAGGLPDRDVGDGAGAAEDADADLAPAGEPRDAVDDVAAGGDLQDVGAQRARALPRDDHRRLRLVLGSRGAAPGTPHHGRRRLLLLRRGLLLLVVSGGFPAGVAPRAVDGVAVVDVLLLAAPVHQRRLVLMLPGEEMLERRRVLRPRREMERQELRRWREVVVRCRRHRIHQARRRNPHNPQGRARARAGVRPVCVATVAVKGSGEKEEDFGGLSAGRRRAEGLKTSA